MSLATYEIYTETLFQIKHELNTVLINWCSDDSWRFEQHSGIYAPYFDVNITTDYDAYNKRAGVSIVLIDMYRQKGYGKDALGLLVKYSFNELCIHQLYGNVLEHNLASICLFKSVGFMKVGLKKDWRYHKGVYKNEYLFQLINYVL